MLQEKLERYLTDKAFYSFEGRRGVQRLEQVVGDVCGYGPYNTLDMFLEDNPGAIAALIDWIGKQRVGDWDDHLEALVGPDEGEEDGN